MNITEYWQITIKDTLCEGHSRFCRQTAFNSYICRYIFTKVENVGNQCFREIKRVLHKITIFRKSLRFWESLNEDRERGRIVTLHVHFLTSSTNNFLEPYWEFSEEYDLWWDILCDIAFGKRHSVGSQISSWKHLFLKEESEWRYLTFCKKKNYDILMDEILPSEYFILPVLRYYNIEMFSLKMKHQENILN